MPTYERVSLDGPPDAQILLNSANARAEHSEQLGGDGLTAVVEAVRGDLYYCFSAVTAALDRLAGAVQGITVPEDRDALKIVRREVEEYDRWVRETPEPERIRDAEMVLAMRVAALRKLLPDDHPGREG